MAFVFSVDGVIGEDANVATKQLDDALLKN